MISVFVLMKTSVKKTLVMRTESVRIIRAISIVLVKLGTPETGLPALTITSVLLVLTTVTVQQVVKTPWAISPALVISDTLEMVFHASIQMNVLLVRTTVIPLLSVEIPSGVSSAFAKMAILEVGLLVLI